MPKDESKLAAARSFDFPVPQWADVLAGLSVAIVVIPQSLAYAQIAGLPLYVGLFAAGLPAVVFALYASSPYLQTGPVAMTSLLTFGALKGAGFDTAGDSYVLAAALLAIMVGLIRLALGAVKFGWVAYLISDPVMIGFTSGAALVIIASQFPKSVGVSPYVPGDGTIPDALWTLRNPTVWSAAAVGLTLGTALLMVGGQRFHRLFPGVLLAVLMGSATTRWFGYNGPTVGVPVPGEPGVGIPEGLPSLSLSLPWADAPSLLLGAVVIALVGFAEPSAIARAFANEDKTVWNPSRELISSGVANITAGISGGYPVGGSFSRSSINRLAGARTRWSGGITGVTVLLFLGFASILEPLPLAVLGGIVLAAVYRLLKPRTMWRMWKRSPTKAGLAWLTFVATVLATPNIHWAVVLGVVLSISLHFARRFTVRQVEARPDEVGALVLKPVGLLWFASQKSFKKQLFELAELSISGGSRPKEIVIDLGDVVAVEVTTIETIAALAVKVAPCPVRVTRGPLRARLKVSEAIERALASALVSD